MEECQRVAGLVPHGVTRTPILAIDVHVGELMAEIPFHTCAAAHEIAPQPLFSRPVVRGVIGIRDHAVAGRGLLIAKDDPLSPGAG